MILFVVPESFYRSPFSVVAALVPLAQQMAKSSVYRTKLRNTQAPRQSQRRQNLRWLQCELERAPLLSAQEKTQSDVEGQKNPGLASDERLHFPDVQAAGDWSHEVPEWLQLDKEGLTATPSLPLLSRLTQCRGGTTCS